jgi:hypothetical protein
MRLIGWYALWLATLCILTIDVKYSDGLEIHLKGWLQKP